MFYVNIFCKTALQKFFAIEINSKSGKFFIQKNNIIRILENIFIIVTCVQAERTQILLIVV